MRSKGAGGPRKKIKVLENEEPSCTARQVAVSSYYAAREQSGAELEALLVEISGRLPCLGAITMIQETAETRLFEHFKENEGSLGEVEQSHARKWLFK